MARPGRGTGPLDTLPRRGAPCDGAWLTCALAFAAFAWTTVLHATGGGPSVDRIVAGAGSLLPSTTLPALDRIAQYGAPVPSLVIVALLTSWMAYRRNWWGAACVLPALAVAVAIESMIRFRIASVGLDQVPILLLHPHGHHLTIGSYPSGHVARLTLLLLIAMREAPGRLRWPAIIACLFLALVVGLRYSYVTAHHGLDLFGGLLLGAACAAMYAASRTTFARRQA